MESSISRIAIDGPASSGKSTVGHRLAIALDYLYFDTGVLYRAVTWGALQHGVDTNDTEAALDVVQVLSIEVVPSDYDDGRKNTVLVDGTDATWELHTPNVDANVSGIARNAAIRRLLIDTQRDIGAAGRVVMIGRDIGTVVLPDADIKFYVTASAEERANRRYAEHQRNGVESDYAEILASIKARDHADMNREVAPLVAADDAYIIDTSDIGIAEVVAEMQRLIAKQHDNSHT